MKRALLPVISLSLLLLGACGALSALGTASRDSAALDARAKLLEAQSSELEQKMEQVRQTLEAYGPLAEDLGPDIKRTYDELLKKYDQMSGYVVEGREILDDVKSLHEESLAKATDEEGNVDWVAYALMMLGGGGGLYSERKKTAKERDRLHARLDKRKGEVADLQGAVAELQKRVEGVSAS